MCPEVFPQLFLQRGLKMFQPVNLDWRGKECEEKGEQLLCNETGEPLQPSALSWEADIFWSFLSCRVLGNCFLVSPTLSTAAHGQNRTKQAPSLRFLIQPLRSSAGVRPCAFTWKCGTLIISTFSLQNQCVNNEPIQLGCCFLMLCTSGTWQVRTAGCLVTSAFLLVAKVGLPLRPCWVHPLFPSRPLSVSWHSEWCLQPAPWGGHVAGARPVASSLNPGALLPHSMSNPASNSSSSNLQCRLSTLWLVSFLVCLSLVITFHWATASETEVLHLFLTCIQGPILGG